MNKALLYKEWLKIKWTFLGSATVLLAVIVYMFLNISHTFELSGATSFWEFVVYKKYSLADELLYIPVVIGILIAVVQFVPEISNGRLKLTLHLPVNEKKILFTMLAMVSSLLILLSIISLLLTGLVLGSYFPLEIVVYNLKLILPGFIAGIIVYLLTAAIMVEPVWNRRVPMILFSAGIVSFLLYAGEYTIELILSYLAFMVLSSILILLSGYYYKRGIK